MENHPIFVASTGMTLLTHEALIVRDNFIVMMLVELKRVKAATRELENTANPSSAIIRQHKIMIKLILHLIETLLHYESNQLSAVANIQI